MCRHLVTTVTDLEDANVWGMYSDLLGSLLIYSLKKRALTSEKSIALHSFRSFTGQEQSYVTTNVYHFSIRFVLNT
jgi:hypothetical protein